MPLSSAHSKSAYNTRFLGFTSEAILEQYCAWLSDPYVAPKKVDKTSNDLLVDPTEHKEAVERLDDQSFITKAPASLVDPSLGPSDNDVLCLLKRRLDYDTFVGPVTHVYVTHLTMNRAPVPFGVKLVRSRGKWSAEPELLDPSFFPFLQSLRLNSDWLLSLLTVNKSVLSPLFRLAKATGQNGQPEADILINHFRHIGPNAFFETVNQAFAWQCALGWPDWEFAETHSHRRIDEISSSVGEICSEDVYERVVPPSLASARPLILSEGPPVQGSLGASGNPHVPNEEANSKKKSAPAQGSQVVETSVRSDLPIKVLLEEERALFSTGGPYDLRFTSTTVCMGNHPAHDLWWWRGYVERTWSEPEIELFADNWARSSFAYEFMAREKYPIQWLVPNRPWNKLTFSMRALLQSALSVDVRGPATLRAHVAARIDADDPELMLYIADLRLSKSRLLADFEAKLDYARGLKNAASGSKDFPKPQWKVLECQDVAYLKRQTLDDTQRSELSKARVAVKKAWDGMLERVGQ